MSVDSYRHQEVVGQVHQLIVQGRVPESQRSHWENRLMRNPSAVRELHLEHRVVPPVVEDPEPPAPEARSGGQMFQAWLGEQKDLGESTGPAPRRPSFSRPTTTASGIDVNAVHRLPWQVQWAVAREGNPTTAYAMLEEYGGPDGDLLAEIAAERPGDPVYGDVQAYAESVERWRENPAVPLREARRDAGLDPASGRPIEAGLAKSIQSFEQANSLLQELDEELDHLNPHYARKRSSIQINRPI